MHHEHNGYGETTEWSAFFAGAFIGAGIALLLAPQTGSELRSRLKGYASDTKDELVKRGQEAWDTAAESGKEYADKAQETVQEAGRAAKEFAKKGQQKMGGVEKEATHSGG